MYNICALRLCKDKHMGKVRKNISIITSKVRPEWFPIGIIIKKNEGGLSKESQIMLNQIKSCDITRFKRKVGKLNESIMIQVDESLSLVLGLNS